MMEDVIVLLQELGQTEDNCGNSASVQQVITVKDFLNVEIISTALQVCTGESISLSANANGTNLTYQWSC